MSIINKIYHRTKAGERHKLKAVPKLCEPRSAYNITEECAMAFMAWNLAFLVLLDFKEIQTYEKEVTKFGIK